MGIRKNIAVSEEGFLFNPTTGDSFSTNQVGSDIITLLKQDKSISDIKTEIGQLYDVDSYLLDRDLDDFMTLLKENNILE